MNISKPQRHDFKRRSFNEPGDRYGSIVGGEGSSALG